MGLKEIPFKTSDIKQIHMTVLKITQYWKAETMRFKAQPEVEVAIIIIMIGDWFLSSQAEKYYWLKKNCIS